MTQIIRIGAAAAKNPASREAPATPVEPMKHAHKTRTGRAAYALRKQIVEPVFGIIKAVMGFSSTPAADWITCAARGPSLACNCRICSAAAIALAFYAVAVRFGSVLADAVEWRHLPAFGAAHGHRPAT